MRFYRLPPRESKEAATTRICYTLWIRHFHGRREMTTTINPPPAAPVRYRTAAEWLHELGDVPLERILFTPWPGTATEADLLRKVEVEKHLCELINGTLVEKPVGLYESQLAAVLIQPTSNLIRPRGPGAVSGEA